MEELIDLLQQIQDLAGVGIEALSQVAGGETAGNGPGGPAPEGAGAPGEAAPPPEEPA